MAMTRKKSQRDQSSSEKKVDFTKVTGQFGEDSAEKYLKKNGFTIIERNFFCRGGEIDIIALKRKELHFIEVKTRSNFSYGNPFESIAFQKQCRLTRAAYYYLFKNKQWNNVAKVFSVMSVFEPDYGDAIIEFIPNAFEAAGDYY